MGKEGRAQAGSRPETAESEKGDRAESRGKSKPKNHIFQELVHRQWARGYTRLGTIDQPRINEVIREQQQLPLYLLLCY